MKNKSNKRSNSQKNSNIRRAYQTRARRSSTPVETARTISPKRIHFGTGPVHLENYWPCLKPSISLKNQKILKRELLRCSNQRPSLLGPQTLQPPRAPANGVSASRSNVQSSSSSTTYDQDNFPRRRSISVHSNTFNATIDRIGPWPDVSISRLRSDGNDLLRPLKTFRNVKNPRVFSPKYYSSLTNNNGQFKFHSKTKTYIDEYRKQKGYILEYSPSVQKPNQNSISSSLQNGQWPEDDQLSVSGNFSGVAGEEILTERLNLLTTDRSFFRIPDQWRTSNDYDQPQTLFPPTAAANSIFPPMPQRTNHGRSTRPVVGPQHGINLPTVTPASMNYLNSMNSVERTYGDRKKNSSRENPSKLFIFDGRSKPRPSHGARNDVENASSSQDYIGFGSTNSEMTSTVETPAITVYQMSRRNDLASWT